jgi:hypothetical protein
VGRTVVLTGIPYSPTAYADGYTQIKIFRSAKNANVLVAITGFLSNSNAAGSTTFTEIAGTCTDTALTNFVAPYITNRKPPTGLASLEEWNGRLWGHRPNDSRVYFTPTDEEVDFGVAAECWPASFSRLVPSRPTGLLGVGEAGATTGIIVQTTQREYGVTGVNFFNNLDFYIYPLPSRGKGGWQGGACSVRGAMVQLSADGRLTDGQGNDLALKVQDRFNLLSKASASTARVYWHSAQQKNYLLVSMPVSGATTPNYTLVLDLDLPDRWYEMQQGFTCFCEVYDSASGTVELWAGRDDGKTRKILVTGTYQDVGVNFAPSMKTAWIRPFGRDVRARLLSVKLYVNINSSGWQISVYRNEKTSASDTRTFFVKPIIHRQNAMNNEMVVDYLNGIEGHCFALKITFPTGNFDFSIEKMVATFMPETDGQEGVTT